MTQPQTPQDVRAAVDGKRVMVAAWAFIRSNWFVITGLIALSGTTATILVGFGVNHSFTETRARVTTLEGNMATVRAANPEKLAEKMDTALTMLHEQSDQLANLSGKLNYISGEVDQLNGDLNRGRAMHSGPIVPGGFVQDVQP